MSVTSRSPSGIANDLLRAMNERGVFNMRPTSTEAQAATCGALLVSQVVDRARLVRERERGEDLRDAVVKYFESARLGHNDGVEQLREALERFGEQS